MTTPAAVQVSHVANEYFRIQDHKEWTLAAWSQHEDAYKNISIQSPCKSGNTDIKGIQRTIKNLQNEITKVQKYSGRLSNLNSAVSVFINEDSGSGKTIKKATRDISGYVKNILGGVRGWILNEVQREAKKRVPFLFPGEMPSFIDNLSKGTNIISCAFSKIVRGLASTVGNLLMQFIDKYVNGPLCIVEDFISGILDNILDPIINSINAALSLITGAVSNLANSLFNALDFASGILSFFDCDDDRACPSVDEINLAGIAGLSGDPPSGSGNVAGGKGSSGAPATTVLNVTGGAQYQAISYTQ